MVVLRSRVRQKVLGLGIGLGLGATLCSPMSFAQNAPVTPSAPIDPYGSVIPVPPPPPAPPPPAPAPAPATGNVTNSGQSGNSISNTNTNTVNPIITANPTNNNDVTNNNDNKNDNRSNAAATATNNNTIYIYPPQVTPPAPSAPPPLIAQPSILPPPLVPPPVLSQPGSPYYRPQRIRLNCARLCAQPPRPISPVNPAWGPPLERYRVFSLGAQFTMLGMAHQPLAGWGTMYGGGLSLEFRSRGRFGFEMTQDFLSGKFGSVGGVGFDRKSYPFQFTLKGYIMPNSDRNHFNMFFGGGLGVMADSVQVPLGSEYYANQSFVEWMVHGDVGAELKFKWLAIGADARIEALFRDHSGSGALYGNISDAPVPNSTWGVQGRGYLKFWF